MNGQAKSKNSIFASGIEALALAELAVAPDFIVVSDQEGRNTFTEILSKSNKALNVKNNFVVEKTVQEALSFAIGASSTGARVIVNLFSELGCESENLLKWALSKKLPLVINGVNLKNYSNTHLFLKPKGHQDIYDLNILAVKLAESDATRSPVIICHDGYFGTDFMEELELNSEIEIEKYLRKDPTLSREKVLRTTLRGDSCLDIVPAPSEILQEKEHFFLFEKFEEVNVSYERLFGRRVSPIEIFASNNNSNTVALLGAGASSLTTKYVVKDLDPKLGIFNLSLVLGNILFTARFWDIVKDTRKIIVFDRELSEPLKRTKPNTLPLLEILDYSEEPVGILSRQRVLRIVNELVK